MDGCVRKRAFGEDYDPLIVQNKKVKKNSGAELKKANLIESKKKSVVEIVKEEEAEGKVVRSIPDTATRRYQLEILDVAIRRNTVVVLETGSGKTLISVLLMKQIAHEMRAKGDKCLIVFLAPTIQLVVQQSDVIKYNTDLQVGYYYGTKGIDSWNVEKWKREIEINEVLVMTPQILLDGLRLSFLKLDMVDLLIFDECHHACGQHPYAKIMKEYYFASQHKPKIFGMTASPVIRKGVSSSVDCEDQIARLEDILHSEVYTLKDRAELDLFVPTPNQITKFYRQPHLQDNFLQSKLVSLREKCIQSELFPSEFKDEEKSMKKARKKLRNIHGNIEYCLENLGLYCAYKAVQLYLAKDSRHTFCDVDTTESKKMKKSRDVFLYDALKLLKQALPADVDKIFNTPRGIAVAVERGLLSPKVHLLVQVLVQYRNAEEMRCIIFVERVIVAAVISSLMQQFECLSFVISDYLSSATSVWGRKKQQKALDLLSTGKVNVLVATDVVEEGIDVQSCSCVIRFDLPKTVRSFIQSRGRARQSGSHFVLLLERDNEKHQKLLYNIIRSEDSMREMAMDRNRTPHIREQISVEMDAYCVLSTGATVNCDASIGFIYKYCAKLPGDTYYSPRPEFIPRKVKGEDNLYECILKLPPNAPFHEVISPPSGKLLHAKQLACLEACKRLHYVGALDEYLQPVTEILPEEEEIMNSRGKIITDAGTTKRKELHFTTKADNLSGSWGENENGVTLQVYKLVFISDCNDEKTYSNFCLLIEAVLDDDVANAEIDLLLTAGRVVKSKFLQCGELELEPGQLRDAKAFQEILCNGVFGKLMRRNKSSEGSRILCENSLKIIEMKNLWFNSDMYFLLPTESEKPGINKNVLNIDWKNIKSCASSARLFKLVSAIPEKDNNLRETLEQVLMDRTALLQYALGKSETISLAIGTYEASELIDKAVVAVHNGKIYCIVEVIHDRTAESPFPQSEDPKEDHYSSYYDYFEKRYGKKLKHLNQPLLRAKQTHRPHNLLTQKSKVRGLDLKVDEANYVEIPPELCLDLGIENSVIRSLYFLPSVMHRLSSLMLASQLRKVISENHPKCPIVSAALIMEALTTPRCLECFSYERLELLGDSFLKYAISRHLFLKYEKKHEGQLSARRSRAVSNAMLHCLAISRNLPGYIRDEPFDARRWIAPGMLCRRSVPCHCNPENLEIYEKPSIEKEDKVVRIGKACDEGHRWMCSKTISDVAEALIGAYLVGGGPVAALEIMKWMNMEVGVEVELVDAAFNRAFVYPCVLRSTNLHGLEILLGYEFKNKALLVEAMTHASQQDPEGGCCYQRLEFLGDSVLDLLITHNLYSTHSGVSPGILTDLRSAAVNNENFARVAVKNNIQKYLRHGSGALLNQITEFVKAIGKCKVGECRFISFGGGIGGPKVLGDLIESIAGAILVDTRFDLERVWDIMKPILSPIVTPETLELHPLRELQELCCQHGFSLKWKFIKQGKVTTATGEVQFDDSVIVGTGSKMNKKTAKMAAAQQILLLLEGRGLKHDRQWKIATDLAWKVAPETGSNVPEHEKMISISENVEFSKVTDNFSEQILVKCNEDNVIMVEQAPTSNGYVDTGESDMVVSVAQCHRGKSDQEDNSIDSGRMISMQKEHLHSFQYLEANVGKNDMLSGREHTFEEDSSVNGKADPYRVEQERVPNSEPLAKRPRLLEMSVNSRKCEECIISEKSDAMICRTKDISNQNWSPDDEFTRLSKADEATNHCEAQNSSIIDKDLASPKNVHVKSALIQRIKHKGVPRTVLRELCTKNKWPEPAYRLTEETGLPHIRSFVYGVNVSDGIVEHLEAHGDARPDKKSAQDSASLMMLLELEKRGFCIAGLTRFY